MLVAGLTGGIASGKSEVSKIFRKLGARVIDADTVSRTVMRPQTACWRQVSFAFGREILKDDLTIDREKLACIVFSDHQKRLQLNRLVHPAIIQQIEHLLAEIGKTEPEALVIIDAALLVESGFNRRCDKVIVLCAAEETQIKRLVERDGMSRTDAQKRINAQLPLSEKAKAADYIIQNDGSLEALLGETRRVFQDLLSCQAAKTL